jgi:pimeloyl-ACP methyl ester carboxylesterase
MPSKPHIVIVPGAWHYPSSFEPTTKRLQAAGYTVHAELMPSTGSSDPPKDLSADVTALNAFVDIAIGDGNDVFVICHSWGGIVTSSAFEGRSASERSAKGLTGGVVRVGYLAAFMTPKGVSLWDMLGGQPLPWFDVQVFPLNSIFKTCDSDTHRLASIRLPQRRQYLLQRPVRLGEAALVGGDDVSGPCVDADAGDGGQLEEYSKQLFAV